MPSKSKAQKKMMDAVAHNPAFAKKVGIKQSVGQDFVAADKKAGARPLPKRVKPKPSKPISKAAGY